MKASSKSKTSQLNLFDSESEFKQRHRVLVDLINQYDQAYYHDNKSLVTDSEYDKLYQELIQLEFAYPEYKTPDSPTQKVSKGSGLGLAKVDHLKPMLSIKTETDYSREAAIKFDQFIRRQLYIQDDQPSPEYIAELKYDGLSLNLIYWNGKLSSAATRGDGNTGEDVTYNVCKLLNIPISLPFPAESCIEIRGEVVMLDNDFNDLNDQLRRLGKPTLATARHAASATVRRLTDDGSVRKLVFLPYGIGHVKNVPFPDKQSDVLLYLKTLGFEVNMLFAVCKDAEELADFHQEINDRRVMLAYGIDGVVYKLNSRDLQNQLGYNAREPRWAVAHKYKTDIQITRLLDIQLDISRTGKLTPIGVLEPVDVNSVVITRCSLHNVFDLRKRNVRVGEFVMVHRAGDVIPEILPAKKPVRTQYYPNFRMPKSCPYCNGDVKRPKGQVHYFCVNHDNCEEQLKAQIVHFFSKPNVYIPGLGIKTIEDLMNRHGKLKPIDFYSLTKEDLMKNHCMGTLVANKIFYGLQKSKVVRLKNFLSALGLPGLGTAKANELVTQVIDKHHLDKKEIIGWVFTTDALDDLVKSIGNQDLKKIFQDFTNIGFQFIP